MSDVDLVGGDFWNVAAFAILMAICLVVLPFAMLLLDVVGVRVPPGLRTAAKRAMILCFVLLVGSVASALVLMH